MSLEKAKGVMIKRVYGARGIRDLPDLAVYTDDTQMSIAIAEALIEAGHKDIETLMERAKGCGSAMRSAPVGYYYQHNPEKLKGVAHITGICTHRHGTADAACIGAAYLVKLAPDGMEPSVMIGELLNFTRGISDEWEEAIEKIGKCLDWKDEEKALSFLGEGWVGEEGMALALYCFLRYPDSYEKCLLRAANTNGDSDSIACIAGAISGAYLGFEAIPRGWVERIENKDYLIDLGIRLAKARERL
ncbi:MAG: ADP-ribosylglycohydrolase family protein [Deltaproteobacteria bacterium]|nr:ADP-ribosylglycohydrolase family protein [Deltaproteobacteria bacterium]